MAKDLNVTPATFGNLNKDDALPNDRLIDDICEKYKIRKEWLTEGKGDMKAPIDRNDEIARLGADLFKSKADHLKSKRLLFALAALDESEWQVLEDIANKIKKKTRLSPSPEASQNYFQTRSNSDGFKLIQQTYNFIFLPFPSYVPPDHVFSNICSKNF